MLASDSVIIEYLLCSSTYNQTRYRLIAQVEKSLWTYPQYICIQIYVDTTSIVYADYYSNDGNTIKNVEWHMK